MSKTDILEWYYANSSDLTITMIFIIMGIALALALVIFFVYRYTYSGVNYNSKFNFSNMIILLVSVIVMLMISSNVVVSLGMVGALSIVRFRTAIKDPRDTAFIFWSIVEGLCVGIRSFELAIVSVFIISAIMIASKVFIEKDSRYFMVIRGNAAELSTSDIKSTIQRYSYQSKIKTMITSGDMQEIIFETRIKNELSPDVVRDLMALSGIQSVNWVSTTGETAA